VFNCPARRAARAIAATGTPAYAYLFAHASALHAEELGYLFTSVPSPGVPRIGDALKDYWARFAATGDPNGGGDPAWPRYEAAGDPQLVFGAEAIAEDRALLMRECDVWDQFEG
jgi:para-nitrobenzyl esterase